MSKVSDLLDTHPLDLGHLNTPALRECIEACIECAQACITCADACLNEDNVHELTACIRDNLDCADICTVTGRMMSRYTAYETRLQRGRGGKLTLPSHLSGSPLMERLLLAQTDASGTLLAARRL
jgi:hypothetical protein